MLFIVIMSLAPLPTAYTLSLHHNFHVLMDAMQMIEYYKWFRDHHGQEHNEVNEHLPPALAAAPKISIPLMLEFLNYTFAETDPSTGKPRRANEKVC